MFIIGIPPQGVWGSKTASSQKSSLKSKKKKSEGSAAEIIDIMKPGSYENIELGDLVPVVELDKLTPLADRRTYLHQTLQD